MRCLKSVLRGDKGSATLEFLAFGVIGSAVILFASTILMQAQAHQFATQQFSKQIARSLVYGGSETRVQAVIATLSSSFAIDEQTLDISINCSPMCKAVSDISPGALVEVKVTIEESVSISRVRARR